LGNLPERSISFPVAIACIGAALLSTLPCGSTPSLAPAASPAVVPPHAHGGRAG